MVADTVSADYGWLHSPDGSEAAQVLFKASKNREGHFTNEDILNQANNTMDILVKHFPNANHILVFDNAMTHTKQADGALSASKMTKMHSRNSWWKSMYTMRLDSLSILQMGRS